MSRFLLILLTISLFVFQKSNAQNTVLLSNNIYHPRQEIRLEPEALSNGKYFLLCQFDQIPGLETRIAMEQRGIRMGDYYPHRTWLMEIPLSVSQTELEAFGVQSAFPFPHLSKLAPEIYATYSNSGFEGYPELLVWLTGAHQLLQVQKQVSATFRPDPEDASGRAYIVQASTAEFEQLLRMPEVQAVLPVQPEIQLEKTYRNTVSRVNYINSGVNGIQFNGDGITCGIREGRYDTDGIDWKGRSINQHSATAISGHATGCAENMGGAGNYDPKFRSTAWGANIMAIEGNYTTWYNTYGLRMINHSYGWGVGGGYNSTSRSHDANVRAYPGMIHIYSAGNVGSSTSNYGPYNGIAGWANLTGAPKQAKNIVAMGNTNRLDALIYGSVGPTYDGRIKPDVCIEGQEGTSYAAPKMGGVMAVLYEVYASLHSGNEPESALIKALLMNTADDVGNAGIDFRSGYGRINARRAYEALIAGNYIHDTIANLDTVVHNLVVPYGTREIRVLLYWTDPEAAVNAPKALVNDLDLEVDASIGNTLKPWVLSHYPHIDSLDALPTRKRDTLNNVEQVTSPHDPMLMTSLPIRVIGSEVAVGTQEYYLVYEFVRDTLLITAPIGREHFVPGETEIIKWDATGNMPPPYSLEYSVDDGNTWTSIATSLTNNSYEWTVPNEWTGKARVRVQNIYQSSVSPEAFHISEVPTNLAVFRSCGDSITLIWDSLAGASHYRVTMLGQKYMDSIGVSNDPWFVVRNVDTTQTNWFSVQAYGPDNALSRRHLAVPWVPHDTNCSPTVDAAMYSLKPYVEGYYPDCYTGSPKAIKIAVRNDGVSALTNIPVDYQVNGGTIYNGTISPTIISPAFGYFSFPDSLSISTAGTYTLKAWCAVPGDANPANDTLSTTFTVYASQSGAIPFTQNFDNFTNCSTAWGCESISCSLSDGWFNVPNTPSVYPDSIDFRTNSGGTGTGGTGPASDHTTGSGKYLYLEGSGNGGSGCLNKWALLHSACLDLAGTNQPVLSWWRHMYGGGIGELHVDILGENGWTEDVALPVSGQQTNAWEQDSVSLASWVGQQIVVRFRASTGPGWACDLAIDDINLRTLPNAAFTAPASICTGSTAQFSSNVTYASSFGWSISPASGWTYTGGTNASSANPQVQFSTNGTFTVTLIANGPGGADTTQQTVNVSLAPTVSVPAQSGTICEGTGFSLVANTTGGGPFSYVWYFNGVPTGDTTATLAIPNSTPANSGTYTVEATNACGTVSDSTSITISLAPIANLGLDVYVCPDSVVTFFATGGTSYMWPDGSTGPTYTPALPGPVWVIIYNSSGCHNSDTLNFNYYSVTTPVISQSNDTLYSTSGVGYQWYLNGAAISGATSSSYYPTMNGSYTVVVTDINGCRVESQPFTFLVGQELPIGEVTLRAFPNPTDGTLQVEISGNLSGTVRLNLADVQGRAVLSRDGEMTGSFARISLDLSQVASGMYFLEVNLPDGGREILRINRQ